jgi:hypothetical protein
MDAVAFGHAAVGSRPATLSTTNSGVALAFKAGTQVSKLKKQQDVTTSVEKKSRKSQKVGLACGPAEGAEGDEGDEHGGAEKPEKQSDPLKGKITEPLPERNLRRAMLW